MMIRKVSLLVSILYIFSGFTIVEAQNWDYEKYPKLDIDITHLQADLNLKDNAEIEGDITYNIEFRVDGVDSLIFDAVGMNLSLIELDDTTLEHEFDGDKLIIYLNEVHNRGDMASLRIQYTASPTFGVHLDEYGSIWTSNLPKSNRHWLPVIDNPRVSFTTNISFSHPAEYSVISSGKRTDSELLTVDRERTTYSSDANIPVTGLSWVMGDFSQIAGTSETSLLDELFDEEVVNLFSELGAPQINIFAASNHIDEEEILKNSVLAFKEVRNNIDQTYPFDELQVVVLDDHTWETKNYGAGTVFVYKNLENIKIQVLRGVLAQWIGVHMREAQWDDPDAILVLQAILGETIGDSEILKELDGAPYNVFNYSELNKWIEFLKDPQNVDLLSLVQNAYPEIINEEGRVLDWETFAKGIYHQTGQPYFERLRLPEPEKEDQAEEQKIRYVAEFEWDEMDQTIQIRFEAENEPVDELVSVQAEQVTFRDNIFHELTFSGASDGVAINVSSDIENLKLSIEERDDIILDVRKPFMFWIYQLRNDDSTDRRVEAASALARFEENPDLQLALDDILRDESDPEVYAAILSSLSSLTRGASGTQNRFIEKSSSQEPLVVQLASVKALAYFPDNDRVISRLRNIAVQTEHSELRLAAVESLMETTDSERFRSLVSDIITRENALQDTPAIIQLLAESGNPEAAIEFGSTFISGEFPYQIRSEVLNIMITYDRNSSNWEQRIPYLISDRDPRIRYKAVQGLSNTSAEFRENIKDDRLHEEFDERVRRVLADI